MKRILVSLVIFLLCASPCFGVEVPQETFEMVSGLAGIAGASLFLYAIFVNM